MPRTWNFPKAPRVCHRHPRARLKKTESDVPVCNRCGDVGEVSPETGGTHGDCGGEFVAGKAVCLDCPQCGGITSVIATYLT